MMTVFKMYSRDRDRFIISSNITKEPRRQLELLDAREGVKHPNINQSQRLSSLTARLITILMTGALLSLVACDDDSPNSSLTAGEMSERAGVFAGDEAGAAAGASAGGEDALANAGIVAGMSERAGSDSSDAPCQELEGETYTSAERFIQEHCGFCHGETPQYGAPFTLTEVSSLPLSDVGLMHLERSVTRLLEGTMPPAGQPRPAPEEAQAFIDWATCGAGDEYVVLPGGFESTRPVYQGPVLAPDDVAITEMTAPMTVIPESRSDDYQCFGFHGPKIGETSEPQRRSIVRFEPVIDQVRVVHHIVLYETSRDVDDGAVIGCGAGLGAAVYAWAPGQEPLHFREGGLVSGSEKRYILEIHYNNSARLEGLTDSSGVRVYHSAPVEPAIDMMTLGPDNFTLPARQRTEVSGDCVLEEEIEIVAMMPHMHEIGTDLNSSIRRAGVEDWEDLIDLSGWDFNAQLVYDGEGTRLVPGDRIRTRCIFNNEGDSPRGYGPFTEDEMCYNFVYVTPPPAERRCNAPAQDNDGSYPVGACAPENLESHQESIMGRYQEGVPPDTTGGLLPTGEFEMSGLEIWFPSYDLGIAVVDPDLSFYEAAGALYISAEGGFALDVQGEINLVSARGAQFMRTLNLSFSGDVTAPQSDELTFDVALSCPEESNLSFAFETRSSNIEDGVSGDELTLQLSFSDPIEGVQVMRFRPRVQ